MLPICRGFLHIAKPYCKATSPQILYHMVDNISLHKLHVTWVKVPTWLITNFKNISNLLSWYAIILMWILVWWWCILLILPDTACIACNLRRCNKGVPFSNKCSYQQYHCRWTMLLSTCLSVLWPPCKKFTTSCDHCYRHYLIAENFWGRKLPQIFRFVAIHEGFLCEIWVCGIFWQHQWAISESLLWKSYFSPICESFFLWKFPAIHTYQLDPVLLRAFCLTLAIKEFRCYEPYVEWLLTHTEWLPGVQLRYSVPPVQYI